MSAVAAIRCGPLLNALRPSAWAYLFFAVPFFWKTLHTMATVITLTALADNFMYLIIDQQVHRQEGRWPQTRVL